jgi:FK506-binding nuclear protein
LKPNKKYTQKIDKPFHISKASLDHTTADNEPVQVMFTHEGKVSLLCTLQKGKVLQESLDLSFPAEADQVCFSIKGNGTVHLTGSLIYNYDDDKPENFQTQEEDDDLDANGVNTSNHTMMEADEDGDSLGDHSFDGDEEDEEEGSDDEEESLGDHSFDGDEEDEEEGSDDEEENGDSNQEDIKGDGKIIKMSGGLIAQELKVGGGPEAETGKKVRVYYEIRLKTNNKVLDSEESGAGFKFVLGHPKIIEGWNLGVVGMKVGGIRRLVFPASLGFERGSAIWKIPRNSKLVCEIELLNVF